LDDGSKTLEESVAMLEMAAASGTVAIVATPHADLEYKFQPEVIRQRVDELKLCSGGKPAIFEGCDFHLTFDNIQDALANPRKYTINHENYLLVEFSDLLIFQNTADIFDSMRRAGIQPVITHPERNTLLQQRLPQLEAWVEAGCSLQVTGQSLLGRFGKTARQFALELLKRRMVHFIASDAHDTKHRPPVLRESFELVSNEFGPGTAEILFVLNPGATLRGAPLEPIPDEAARTKKWFHFFR
jgi:protein-tyrosine phosphatase